MSPDDRRDESHWTPPTVAELQASLAKFEILKCLGEGGMGAVYLARHQELDRLVAIKILPEALTREEHASLRLDERFRREARTLARMQHPAITNIHDFGFTESGLHYFVMEYVDGVNLHDYLHSKGGTLPLQEVLYVARQVLDALDYAHGLGILHRDIKPANILVRRKDGHVKLVDFGLAKFLEGDGGELADLSALTLTNVAMGTPDFVPPEALIPGAKPDARADIYAVGVTLYLLLTGRIPKGKFKPISGVVPQIDPRVDSIIERAMEMDVADRYQSAADFRQAIKKVSRAAKMAATPLAPETVAGDHRPTAPERPSAPISSTQIATTLPPSGEARPGEEAELRLRRTTLRLLIAALVLICGALLGLFLPWDQWSQTQQTQVAGERGSAAGESGEAAIAQADAPPVTPPLASPFPRGTTGRVRVAGFFNEPLPVYSIEFFFGQEQFYEVMAGHFGRLVARRSDGTGIVVRYDGEPELVNEPLRILARDYGTHLANRHVRGREARIPIQQLPLSAQLFSGDFYFFIYLDGSGRAHHGGVTFSELNEPAVDAGVLNQMERDAPLVMSLSRVPPILTYVTPENQVRTFYHHGGQAGQEIDVTPQPSERIVDLVAGGGEFGAWLALSENGHVYAEGQDGFSSPIEALSPAIQLRSSGPSAAVQRPDGTWFAMGPDDALNDLVAEVGASPDLDIEHNPDGPVTRIVIWLEPTP